MQFYDRFTAITLILTFLIGFTAHAQKIELEHVAGTYSDPAQTEPATQTEADAPTEPNTQNVELERVEPMFWWTGMQEPELQLMLYGENIGELTPEIDYQGVTIRQIVSVENNNYLFLYLHISELAEPGTFDISLTRNDRQEAVYSYELKKRKEGSVLREGFDSSDVIYLITPDRFANGDPANDELEEYADKLNMEYDYGRHGGDLQGIIDHLDYIEEMGFTAIWLNPVLENAMPRHSYHGYSTTDYYKVDPRFGSNELYREMSREAEKRGIKIIKDLIMNHIGLHHWWMDDSPSSDWVHYQEEYRITNHRRTTQHDPYASEADLELMTSGWFVPSMPDLNQNHPLLADYLITNSLWWIEYAGLRGIRHDTHPYVDREFLNRWTCRILEEYPNFNIVGEEWALEPLTLAKWQRGNDLLPGFDSCLPSLMDFPLQASLFEALTDGDDWDSGFVKVYEQLSFDYIYPDPQNLVIFGDNHDKDRFYRQVNNDYDLFRMGMVYLMTMRGIPQIYYGTEILMSNEIQGSHGNIRSDFPGGWPSDEVNAFTGEGLSDQQLAAREFTKKLLNWRKKAPVIHNGKLMHFAPEHDGFYVYFRYNDEDTVMVILNKQSEEALLDTGRFLELIEGFESGIDVISGQTFSLDRLEVPGRSALILELE